MKRRRKEKDEELLESSARVAQRTGLREEDAVEIVREWREQQETEQLIRETIETIRCKLTEDDDIEGIIKEFRRQRRAKK